MKYEVEYELPRKTITVEAESEWDAENLIDKLLDGIHIDKTFRLSEIEQIGIREVQS